MAKIYRTTNMDARAMVSDDGRAYQLSDRRRAWLKEQHAAELADLDGAAPAAAATAEPYPLTGKEPIIDCIRKLDGAAGYTVTTGDFRETELSADQVQQLLGDE